MNRRDTKAFLAAKNRLAATQPRKSDPYRTRKVASVNTDGTVNLDWGFDEDGSPVVVASIPCEVHVSNVQPGDVVRVLVTDDIIRTVTAKL